MVVFAGTTVRVVVVINILARRAVLSLLRPHAAGTMLWLVLGTPVALRGWRLMMLWNTPLVVLRLPVVLLRLCRRLLMRLAPGVLLLLVLRSLIPGVIRTVVLRFLAIPLVMLLMLLRFPRRVLMRWAPSVLLLMALPLLPRVVLAAMLLVPPVVLLLLLPAVWLELRMLMRLPPGVLLLVTLLIPRIVLAAMLVVMMLRLPPMMLWLFPAILLWILLLPTAWLMRLVLLLPTARLLGLVPVLLRLFLILLWPRVLRLLVVLLRLISLLLVTLLISLLLLVTLLLVTLRGVRVSVLFESLGRLVEILLPVHVAVLVLCIVQPGRTFPINVPDKVVRVDEAELVRDAAPLLLAEPGVRGVLLLVLEDILVLVQRVNERVHEVVDSDLFDVTVLALVNANLLDGLAMVLWLLQSLVSKSRVHVTVLEPVPRVEPEHALELHRRVVPIVRQPVPAVPPAAVPATNRALLYARRALSHVGVGGGAGLLVGGVDSGAGRVAADGAGPHGRQDPGVLGRVTGTALRRDLPLVRALPLGEGVAVVVHVLGGRAHVVAPVPVRLAARLSGSGVSAPQAGGFSIARLLFQRHSRIRSVCLDVVALG